jgi:hypothetical protein
MSQNYETKKYISAQDDYACGHVEHQKTFSVYSVALGIRVTQILRVG